MVGDVVDGLVDCVARDDVVWDVVEGPVDCVARDDVVGMW